MVKRACLFENPTTPTTSTTSTTSTTVSTTTAYRKLKIETEADVKKMEPDRVMQPAVAEPAYPNLVSILLTKQIC